MNASANTALEPQPGRGAFKNDLLASVVVFLVALPLCLGIAIASGAPPVTGLITGIIGGLVVGFLAGSPLQVSGPAAGLAVIVADLIQRHGLENLAIIITLAGILQFVAGLFRLGQWFRAVAPAVIQGMLAGIGWLIFASQFHVMVDDEPRGNGLQNLLSIPEAIMKGVTVTTDANHHHAAIIGLLTILVIMVWKPIAPRRLRFIPAPLVAVIAATIVSELFGWPILRISLPDNFFGALELPNFAALDWANVVSGPILFAAFTVAAVASAETLLCATAVDQIHSGPRTRYDRELWAQGVGNFLTGMLGGLPMTGVIVRSSANVEAGAKTRLSAILHGAWLLIFVAALPGVLQLMPKACLAAVLVFTGYKLMNFRAIARLRAYGWGEVAIYAATLIMIVCTDLLTGVVVGIVLSLLKLVYTFSHLNVAIEMQPEHHRTILHLTGAATFIRLPRLAAALESVPPSTELHVQFDRLTYIDHACLNLLVDWEKQHETTGGKLTIDWEGLTARFRQTPDETVAKTAPEPDAEAAEESDYRPAEVATKE